MCNEGAILFITDSYIEEKRLIQLAKLVLNKQCRKKIRELHNVTITDNSEYIVDAANFCDDLIILKNITTVEDLLIKFNLKKEDLVKILEVHKSQIDSWCRGEDRVPYKHWKKIKDVYGVEITV